MKTAIWKIMVPGIVALCLCRTPTAFANTTNVAPFAQSFENLGYDESLIDTQGWYGFSNRWAVATNIIPIGVLYPISGQHDKSIRLNTEFGSITNLVDPASINSTNMWLDCLMQFTQWTDDNPPDLTNTNDPAQINQLGLYVATGKLVVAHGFYTNNTADSWTNCLTTITNLPTIGSQDWVRVTIFRTIVTNSLSVKNPFYLIQINGTNVYDDNWAHQTNVGKIVPVSVAATLKTGGVWFASMNAKPFSNKAFSNTIFSGTGYFDDFVITNGIPRQQVSWLVKTELNPAHGGTITPTMIVDDMGAAVINVSTSAYWSHKYWTHNAASNPATTDYTITINPVTNNNYITSYVAQLEVTNTGIGVTMPMWWLATYGLYNPPTSINITNDLDLDGKLNWEEWLASTDPNDSNSVFEITKHYTTNDGNIVLEWITKAVDPALLSLPFRVDRSEDLTTGWITNYGARSRASGTTTNRWTNSSPPSAASYRIVATN